MGWARSAETPPARPTVRHRFRRSEGVLSGRVAGRTPHLATDVIEVPSRQHRQRLRLALATFAKRRAIAFSRVTRRLARPRMAQHIAPLEVAAVSRLLKDQILREMFAVVADM